MGTIRPAPKVIKWHVFDSVWGQQVLEELTQLRYLKILDPKVTQPQGDKGGLHQVVSELKELKFYYM
jgi:hypothetical protein